MIHNPQPAEQTEGPSPFKAHQALGYQTPADPYADRSLTLSPTGAEALP